VKGERRKVKGAGRRPNLVGRGSRKIASFTGGNRRIPIEERVRPLDAPSRGLLLSHGSDVASRWSVPDYGRKAMSGKSARFSV
jgi:hypothetical protein